MAVGLVVCIFKDLEELFRFFFLSQEGDLVYVIYVWSRWEVHHSFLIYAKIEILIYFVKGGTLILYAKLLMLQWDLVCKMLHLDKLKVYKFCHVVSHSLLKSRLELIMPA